jgi:hypothetical protein
MSSFLITMMVVFAVFVIVLQIKSYKLKQEIKEMEQRNKKKRYNKEEIKLYEIFCQALTKGIEVDFSGVKCKLIDNNRFIADNVVYQLNIENFLKVLKGE